MMTLDIAIHRNILIRILKDIYINHAIGSFLGFKGGTAAYLFYHLSRFSVDLDFDLLNSTKESHVFDEIKKILNQYGTVKESRHKRYSLFFLLSYTNKIHQAYNIKVEINLREFGSQYEILNYLGIPIKVMIKEHMAAHKMVAMFERMGSANRDIFDTWFFLSNHWPIDEKIIHKRTGFTLKQFLEKCIHGLETMTDRHILSGLGELLNPEQKIWVKTKLRVETIFLLKMLLD